MRHPSASARSDLTVPAGQSEAGKSTLLKNFQLHFAPKAFHAEAESWRAVIHLNLVRAVNFILSHENLYITNPAPRPATASSNASHRSSSSISTGSSARQGSTESLRHLRIRLSPLRQVELILQRRLCVDGSSPPDDPPGSPRSSDLSVRVRSGWKGLARVRRPTSTTHQDELQNARQIIDACRDDIIAVWADEAVQAGLREQSLVLEDHCV